MSRLLDRLAFRHGGVARPGSGVHLLAVLIGDLAGAYNGVEIRRWFERPRTLLDGKAPQELLRGEWDPEDPGRRRVCAGPLAHRLSCRVIVYRHADPRQRVHGRGGWVAERLETPRRLWWRRGPWMADWGRLYIRYRGDGVETPQSAIHERTGSTDVGASPVSAQPALFSKQGATENPPPAWLLLSILDVSEIPQLSENRRLAPQDKITQ
jgi:hypothetical protein